MFEGADLLDEADTALLQQILDRELCDSYEHEITEAEYLRGQIDELRQAPNLAFARELSDTELNALTDAQAVDRLIQVEAGIARAHSLRARLVALVAAHRPASADRPDGKPGAAGWQTRQTRKTATATSPASGGQARAGGQARTDGQVGADVVPEVLDVSEWLAHELQMAHPYSRTAAQDLVETSLILTGRLSATLALLGAGRIDYPRARVLTDLLGTCSTEVAHTVQAMVLPKAPGLTPGGLATAIRRALARVDAAALRRRHARARRSAEVGYHPTQDGMARLYADLPLPVAAACVDAIGRYAKTQHDAGDDRPIGQPLSRPKQRVRSVHGMRCTQESERASRARTEILTDLILRPWDTTRPPVTAEITIHLTIPTSTGAGNRLDDTAVQAEVDGQTITAAQCAELLTQLQASRLFLALHGEHGDLQAVASPAQLRRAARRRQRRAHDHAGTDRAGPDGPGLRSPKMTDRYRPTRAQDRHVRTRDRTCRHFGCTRKAVHADLDHHVRHPEGATTICNLCCYCRTHHRLKHQAPGWTRDFQADATLTITTPTGITRTTRPPGPATGPDWPKPAIPQRDPSHPITSNNDPPPF